MTRKDKKKIQRRKYILKTKYKLYESAIRAKLLITNSSLSLIFDWLRVSDLAIARRVCKQFANIVIKTRLWISTYPLYGSQSLHLKTVRVMSMYNYKTLLLIATGTKDDTLLHLLSRILVISPPSKKDQTCHQSKFYLAAECFLGTQYMTAGWLLKFCPYGELDANVLGSILQTVDTPDHAWQIVSLLIQMRDVTTLKIKDACQSAVSRGKLQVFQYLWKDSFHEAKKYLGEFAPSNFCTDLPRANFSEYTKLFLEFLEKALTGCHWELATHLWKDTPPFMFCINKLSQEDIQRVFESCLFKLLRKEKRNQQTQFLQWCLDFFHVSPKYVTSQLLEHAPYLHPATLDILWDPYWPDVISSMLVCEPLTDPSDQLLIAAIDKFIKWVGDSWGRGFLTLTKLLYWLIHNARNSVLQHIVDRGIGITWDNVFALCFKHLNESCVSNNCLLSLPISWILQKEEKRRVLANKYSLLEAKGALTMFLHLTRNKHSDTFLYKSLSLMVLPELESLIKKRFPNFVTDSFRDFYFLGVKPTLSAVDPYSGG